MSGEWITGKALRSMGTIRTTVTAIAVAVAAVAVPGCASDPGGAGPAPRAAVVWAVGDVDAREPRARHVIRRILADEPDRVLYLGDVYDAGTPQEFRRRFDRVFRPLVARTWPTPGNHEWPNRDAGYFPYWRRAHGRPQAEWYSADLAGWQVISLNSEAGMEAGSPQHRWLTSQLSGQGDCRLAFWHRPRYSAGLHGDSKRVKPLWEALRGRARIVVAGHDHNLQRLRLIDGLTSFVSGAGGRARYPVDRRDERLAFGDDDRFGALRLELRPGMARHAFIAADGSVLDEGTVACDPGT